MHYLSDEALSFLVILCLMTQECVLSRSCYDMSMEIKNCKKKKEKCADELIKKNRKGNLKNGETARDNN